MSRAPLVAAPDTLESALELLAASPWQPLAGGTALVPALRRLGAPRVLSLHALRPELRFVAVDARGLRAGAMATLRDLASSAGVRDHFPLLATAARAHASAAHQHRATVGGTLVTRSGPMAAAFAALDASVELRSCRTVRRVAAATFEPSGRLPSELVTALVASAPPPRVRQSFGRATTPAGTVYLAAVVALTRGTCVFARLAVASRSGGAVRLASTERVLTGERPGAALTTRALAAATEDVHACADWRQGRDRPWPLGRLLADALAGDG